jgi:predicted nuclease with TOPRIM domain
MADPMAQEILRTGARPSNLGDGELWVIVAEGEIDYLTAVQLSAAYPVATFGIVSGSWTREIAARIPDGAIVVAATDPDPAGDRYAEQIFATFRGRRVKLNRWRHPMAQQQAAKVQP